MSLRTRVIIVSVLGVLALITGVLFIVRSSPQSEAVGAVVADPSAYYGKVVRLSGAASGISPVSVKGFRVFHLTDRTGSIWVLTRLAAPQSGAQIAIQGRVNSGITAELPVIGEMGVGAYFVEEKRLASD